MDTSSPCIVKSKETFDLAVAKEKQNQMLGFVWVSVCARVSNQGEP